MKKIIKILTGTISIFLICMRGYSQSDIVGVGSGHDRANGYFVGWRTGAGSTSGTLEIKNDFSSDINFSTNGTQKATILSGGNIGIGTTSPNNLVHAYKSGTSDDLYMQWSNGNTTYSSGLWAGINTNNVAELNMKDNKAFKLLTHDVLRFYVDDDGGSNRGFVGIGNAFSSPVSRLHINESGANNDGWIQLTNANTGSASTNGLRMGVKYTSKDVEIRQQENAAMRLYTNGTEHLTIAADGNIGAGIATKKKSSFSV